MVEFSNKRKKSEYILILQFLGTKYQITAEVLTRPRLAAVCDT